MCPSASNGGVPYRNSYVSTPNDHRSTWQSEEGEVGVVLWDGRKEKAGRGGGKKKRERGEKRRKEEVSIMHLSVCACVCMCVRGGGGGGGLVSVSGMHASLVVALVAGQLTVESWGSWRIISGGR